MLIDTYQKFDLTLKSLGFLGVLATFIAGLRQYRNAQHWKRVEFVAAEIKEFESDPTVMKAMQILDWNSREIDLLDDPQQPRSTWPTVDDEMVSRALRPLPDENTEEYDAKEVAIRDIFDIFLGFLSRFDNYIESDLVDYRAFDPYLRYWLDIIVNPANTKKDEHYRKLLLAHIECFFPDAKSLLKRYTDFMARSSKPSMTSI